MNTGLSAGKNVRATFATGEEYFRLNMQRIRQKRRSVSKIRVLKVLF